MRNASLSFSSGEPLEVTCRASMNSLHKDNLGVTVCDYVLHYFSDDDCYTVTWSQQFHSCWCQRFWRCSPKKFLHFRWRRRRRVTAWIFFKLLLWETKYLVKGVKSVKRSPPCKHLWVHCGRYKRYQNIWSKVSKDPHLGNIFEYMAINLALLSSPLGQSFRKPTYHSCRAEDDQNKVYIFL